jgi:hypothetical protein
MAIASLTVMLWILWADTIRKRPPAPILYTIRIALFLIMSGVLTLNLVRYPFAFSGTARALAILAVLVGVAGAVYFGRKLVRRI